MVGAALPVGKERERPEETEVFKFVEY